MCEKDPPGPMAEPTAQKLGRLGVAMVGWGSAKNMVPGFSLQATIVREDIVVGLGCIDHLQNPLVTMTLLRVGSVNGHCLNTIQALTDRLPIKSIFLLFQTNIVSQ